MNTIVIKYLSKTNRLKAITEIERSLSPYLMEWMDHSIDNGKPNIAMQAERLANRYINHLDWGVVVSGFGRLPNGDYVATLKNK